MSTDLYLLPGNVLGGALLIPGCAVYCYRGDRLVDDTGIFSDRRGDDCRVWHSELSSYPNGQIRKWGLSDLRIVLHDYRTNDPTRAANLDRIARVLREGKPCSCGGFEQMGMFVHAERCDRRPPHDIRRLITADLPPAWVAALVGASVLWVEAGARPITMVIRADPREDVRRFDLAVKCALIDGDVLRLPTPDGVRVLDREGREVIL